MPGSRPAPAPDSTGSSPVSEPAVPAAAQPQPAAPPANAVPAKPTTGPTQGTVNNN